MTVNKLERLKEQRNNIINAQRVLSAVALPNNPVFKTSFLNGELKAVEKLIKEIEDVGL